MGAFFKCFRATISNLAVAEFPADPVFHEEVVQAALKLFRSRAVMPRRTLCGGIKRLGDVINLVPVSFVQKPIDLMLNVRVGPVFWIGPFQ